MAMAPAAPRPTLRTLSTARATGLAARRAAPAPRRAVIAARAERRDGGGFVSGFILGGVVFGALGFLFAPQISAALLSEENALKLPRFLEEDTRTPEETKQDLADKIAQLNSAIDDVSAQLRAQDLAAAVGGGEADA